MRYSLSALILLVFTRLAYGSPSECRVQDMPFYDSRIKPIVELGAQFPEVNRAFQLVLNKKWSLRDADQIHCEAQPSLNGVAGVVSGCQDAKSVVLLKKSFGDCIQPWRRSGAALTADDARRENLQADMIVQEMLRELPVPKYPPITEDSYFYVVHRLTQTDANGKASPPDRDELFRLFSEKGFPEYGSYVHLATREFLHQSFGKSPDPKDLLSQQIQSLRWMKVVPSSVFSPETRANLISLLENQLRNKGVDPNSVPPLSQQEILDMAAWRMPQEKNYLVASNGDQRNVRTTADGQETLARSTVEGRTPTRFEKIPGFENRAKVLLKLFRDIPELYTWMKKIIDKEWLIDPNGIKSCLGSKGPSDFCQDGTRVILNGNLFHAPDHESRLRKAIAGLLSQAELGEDPGVRKNTEGLRSLLEMDPLPTGQQFRDRLNAFGFSKFKTRSELVEESLQDLSPECTKNGPIKDRPECLLRLRSLLVDCFQKGEDYVDLNVCLTLTKTGLETGIVVTRGPKPSQAVPENCEWLRNSDEQLRRLFTELGQLGAQVPGALTCEKQLASSLSIHCNP